MPDSLSKALLGWYAANRRDLPWRRTRDPYRIWVSEVMLQQTRVAAVLPYYERFVGNFPTVEALADAAEQDLLAAWSGLGYYSRARNLQKAARQIHASGCFPRRYPAIRALPGVGDYTAAALASIAFGLPYAVVDGNVRRVLARLSAEDGDVDAAPVRRRLETLAGVLLHRREPGDFNQAMMELGATVCLPREPNCPRCPLASHCLARQQGRQRELPVKARRVRMTRIEKTLLYIEQGAKLLLWRRPEDSPRLAGFWELPEPGQVKCRPGRTLGDFQHSITNHDYRISVRAASLNGRRDPPPGFDWVDEAGLAKLPLSTTTRKALKCLGLPELGKTRRAKRAAGPEVQQA